MLVMTAIGMIVLMAVAALAIDLAAVRDKRTSGKRATDAAATAAALHLATPGLDAQNACQAAMDYLALNGVSATFSPPMDCTQFPTTCDEGVTPSVTESTSSGPYTVTITHPVPDTDPAMESSAVGADVQAIIQADGDSCDRISVSVRTSHPTVFGGVVGYDTVDSTVHSVALANPSALGGRALNLLVLERYDCDAVEASGAGGTGGIIVGGVIEPSTGRVFPGTLAVDSDGSGSGCGNDGTVDVNGSNGLVRADSEPCAHELWPGTGEGCGVIELYAPGTPGCFPPACTSAGTVAPDPNGAPARLTRAPVDWIFNCKASYPAAYDIEGCPDAATKDAYIDELVAAVGPSGLPSPAWEWNDYSPTYPCSISPSDTITVPNGNWRVNCDLSIRGELIFEGGNVVFDGDVGLNSSGVLDMNGSNDTPNWLPSDYVVDIGESSSTFAFAYFRDGTLSKAGQASVYMRNMLGYYSSTSTVDLGGGSGSVAMIAPTEGPFKNLAMWSESAMDVDLAGQANIELEGVFFTPLAKVSYQGNGGQSQVAAQFISLKLAVGGNGALVIKPRFDRLVTFPEFSTSTLIR